MMKVKVIKRDVLNQPATPVATPSQARASKRAAAQEMVQNVNSWVSDWRQRKQAETVAAYRQFLGDAAPLARS